MKSTVYLLALFFIGSYSAAQDIAQKALKVLEQHEETGYSGAVVLAHHDSVYLSGGYGFTAPSGMVANTDTTLFNIASISKSLTAIAVLQLYEAEKLNLHHPIATYLNGVPKKKQGITIHHLLTHTSGLRHRYVNDGVKERNVAVQNIMKQPLKAEPGEVFGYSNLNYQLLAALVERVSGEKFETFVRTNILKPSGMVNTLFWDEVAHHDEQAVAQKLERFKQNKQARNWGRLGSGGVFSSAKELFLFFEAVHHGKLLNNATTRLMLTNHMNIREGLEMGYGWFIGTQNNGAIEIWTRGNESFGHNAVLRWFPEEELVIVVTSNTGEKGSPTETDNRIVSDHLVRELMTAHETIR